ncbi:MAG: dihydrolipoyl dehydrogenase [Betaproteobacteria bacterium]|nr:dihydrolipoyl dehydrogenase [Betaproteobacteria bacterium]
MTQAFDVVVIGGGPGGYIGAIRAAQLGLSVACVDAWSNAKNKPSLGGTCLNVGCIPSKALLESSENYERAQHHFAEHGVMVGQLSLDLAQMLARKDRIVDQLTGGVAYLFKKNKVTSFHGHGRFDGSAEGGFRVVVRSPKGEETVLQGRHVIIATGSVPRPIPAAPVDNEFILDNVGALSMTVVPKRLGVIGAGVIGLEMGSVWKRLGSEVTLLEALDAFLPTADEQVSREALRMLTKDQGLDIRLGAKVTQVVRKGKALKVTYSDANGEQVLDVDRLIVAVGRVPSTEGLQLESVGVTCDARGFIEVDGHCRTAVPGIWAVGDAVRGPMLAHKAEEEGVAVAEQIAGQQSHVDFNTIPWVIYTAPEMAWVGQTEQQLRAQGVDYRTGVFPFAANGRAKSLGETRGFVKILADRQTDRMLGVHILGPFASELITEAVVALEFHASSEDIARIVHAHPALSEVFHEAALAVDGRSLNM